MRFSMNYAVLAVTISVPALPALGASLCVNSTGFGSCYATITEAVGAAAPNDVISVAPGTYRESVVIGKAVSIAGHNAVIDATGLPQGFFVNGLVHRVGGVQVTGFTIKNANFEGVLVLNATDVTVANNVVTHNNLALADGHCPTRPVYEPGEDQDCGEGIHLQGADHSIVTNNTVEENSGGILLSDDTGPNHDNLVSLNMVSSNPYACGITMASHVPSPTSGATQPYGVYHNTVYGNRSEKNGLAIGGGAGVGIFASIPYAKAFANVVVGNLVSGNGLPGVAMHAHAPFQSLNDNMVVGNTVVGNGPDTEDAKTPGPTGINLYSLTPVTGNVFSGNLIQDEAYDIAVKVPALVMVHFNALLGLRVGVDNLGVGEVDATGNWFGCGGGPGTAGSCSAVEGLNVLSAPWLEMPTPAMPTF